jgi:hypothetical protein
MIKIKIKINLVSDGRGFSLIDVMIAMGLSATAIITTITVISQAARVRRIENLRSSAIAVREILIKNMARYDNFQETIHNNDVFNCAKLSGGFNCGAVSISNWEGGNPTTSIGGGAVAKMPELRYATNKTKTNYASFTSEPFYNAANPAEGFTDDGLLCSTLSPKPTQPAPNGQCPIRVNIYWWNLCSAPCNPGLLGFKIDIITYNAATKKTLVTPYGFRLIKSVYPNGTAGPFPDPP